MIGTGPAAQAAAYYAAGVPMHRVAAELRLPPAVVSRLALGFWLHASRADGLALADHEDGRCMVQGCSRPRQQHRLCAAHLARFYRRRPAAPRRRRPRPQVFTCTVCGVRWCPLVSVHREPRTCGSHECLTARRRAPHNSDINTAILERVRAGDPYAVIGADYGVSDRRISQLANAHGMFRRSPRGPIQRTARARRTTPPPEAVGSIWSIEGHPWTTVGTRS